MTTAIWIAASLLLTGFGLPAWRMPLVARMDRAARLAIALACGNLIAGVLLYAMSLAGIAWSRTALLLLLIAVAIAAFAPRSRRAGEQPESPNGGAAGGTHTWLRRSWSPIAVLLLAIYGAATARMTCADILYFWGPKAEKFFSARRIDVEFLRFPHYYLMHPDYPPLQPLVYVWSSMAAHRFSHWGAILLAPLYLAATAAVFHGFAAPVIGRRRATAAATLLAAVLAFGFTAGLAAGGADPLLLLFEITALSALTFSDTRSAHALAAMALAGAVFTKVEGAAFAVVLLLAFLGATRRLRATLTISIPPLLLLGSWIAFARHHHLLDSYGRGETPLQWDRLGYVAYMTAWKAAYRVAYLPWLASLGGLVLAVNWRRAALPLLVGLGSIAYTLFFYLHEPQPLWWIQASAERVLLTPLAAFVVATAAASE